MKVKSHAEVATIADPTERYLVEAGTEKLEEINQCITNASTEVNSLLLRFLSGTSGAATATDSYETADIIYTLDMPEAPTPTFAAELTRAIHAYIVDSALALFYQSVSQGNLSTMHASKLPSEITIIRKLIYYRPMP